MADVAGYMDQQFERPGLTPSEINEIKQAFALFDANNDGRIDTQELKAAMQALGFDSRHEKVFSKLQQHQEKSDGRIEFEDFLDCIAANVGDELSRKDIKRVFDIFDDNESGKVSLKELKRVAKELGETLTETELLEIINRADTDGDGGLNLDEFYAIVTHKN